MPSPVLGTEAQHTAEPPAHDIPGRSSKMARAGMVPLVVRLVAELMDVLDQSVVLTALPAVQESTGAGSGAAGISPGAIRGA